MLLLGSSGGGGAAKTYVDDVFSTWTYTGNGATQTVTNGIDLAGKGGLVWIKDRGTGGAVQHHLVDTVRGASEYLFSNGTNGSQNSSSMEVTGFNSNGFSLGSGGSLTNYSAYAYASWSFRKAAKFFDVQTATVTGGGDATVSFSSLSTLGMVIVKRTDSTGNWYVWHRSLTAGKLLYLNLTDAEATLGHVTVSGTTVTLEGGVIADGSYVVYGFAHDTATDGIIQCGSFTTDGSGNATVNLGWEPQYILIKQTNSMRNWEVVDTMRGPAAPYYNPLFPNTSGTEAASGAFTANAINATGFKVLDVTSATYIYLAIRRPNKPPTLGTQVYNAIARTGTGAAATVTGVGFAPDLVAVKTRSVSYGNRWTDRLRGAGRALSSDLTDAEFDNTTIGVIGFDVMDGAKYGAGNPYNNTPETYINHFFRRAPGVFDEVCYTGTGVAKTEAHNLGVAPELMIVKKRSAADGGVVYSASLGANYEGYLFDNVNGNAGFGTPTDKWNSTLPTSTVFSLSANAWVNASSATYVAYLFATKAGISKVGSYTGNGSSQTINCGFTTGARFILIKRTDSTGDWFVWDSVRGIVAGNDPHLSLNTTAAEVTTDDSIDPDTSGFIVNQDAATNINVTSATYIYLAFA